MKYRSSAAKVCAWRYIFHSKWRAARQRVKALGLGGSEQITTWRYNQAGQVVRRILPNDVRQLFAYDSAGRLSQIKYQKADATLIEQIDYSYDTGCHQCLAQCLCATSTTASGCVRS